METLSIVSAVKIDQWQRKRQLGFKSVPDEGRTITYLGKAFHVYPDTFWPFLDSQPLVRKLRIAPGQSVLDVGTGSGVIAVFASLGGAGRVLAVDINPAALRSARRNARQHGVDGVMEVRRSDLFEQVGDERFDVITANLPFRNKAAPDVVAQSQWDTGFRTNTRFFEQVGAHLKPGGRVYFAHANFGEVDEVRRLARQAGLRVRRLASSIPGEGEERQFHVFLIKPAASA